MAVAPPETSWSLVTLLPLWCPTSDPPADPITSSPQTLPEPSTSHHCSGQGPVVSQRDRGEHDSAGPWLLLLPRRAFSHQKSDHIVSLRNTRGLSPHTQDRAQRPHPRTHKAPLDLGYHHTLKAPQSGTLTCSMLPYQASLLRIPSGRNTCSHGPTSR